MLSDLPWQIGMIWGNGRRYFDLFLNSLDSRKMLITFIHGKKNHLDLLSHKRRVLPIYHEGIN